MVVFAVSKDISPWVKKSVLVYVILVVAGALMGLFGGGLAGIYVMPLLLPWIAIAPTIELNTGWNLLGNIGAGPLTILIAGAINAYILFLILRFIDRRRRRKRDGRAESA